MILFIEIITLLILLSGNILYLKRGRIRRTPKVVFLRVEIERIDAVGYLIFSLLQLDFLKQCLDLLILISVLFFVVANVRIRILK
ncbi:hypothetical protein PPO43_00535 [Saprospira sp. CCB-QB6]|uniref:hypothetical protein n=1 Tax=Saprospira sp. CCB-QB6 TaxID=3023936 RepID=UPI00234ACB22|nr:hypothetical protein [Saprospira sp. CCB-QB6]WCL81582.1 hypothetical protein PPO43_00535 [Saprospira sp. CCB-QB6]